MKQLKKFLLLPLLVFALLFSINVHPASANNHSSQGKNDFLVTLETIEEFVDTISPEEFSSHPHLEKVIDEMREFVTESGSVSFRTLKNEISGQKAYQDHITSVSINNESHSVSTNNESYQNFLTFTSEELKELERIDALALEYYNYYQEHGFFPTDKQKNDMIGTASASLTPVLSGLGINYSASTLASRLATLGMIAAVDGPMPVGDFIALLAGVVIVGGYVYNYISTAAKPSIINSIKANEGQAYEVPTTTSLDMSTAITTQSAQYKHFKARPNNGWGGGVLIEQPITFYEAGLRAFSGLDTYNLTYNDALAVATSGSDPGKTPVHHGAHKYDSYGVYRWPHNKNHWHAVKTNGTHKPGHHWYG